MNNYVHGYSEKESSRLADQAETLTELLHYDTIFPSGSQVLESGCGTGAQTVTLAGRSPGAQITSIDISRDSLSQAEKSAELHRISNVIFKRADIFNLPFEDETFDHVFICFVLEHLQDPLKAINCLKRVLKKGGTVTAIEGDHGSWYCYPETREAKKTVQCLIDIQAHLKGNSLIGRQLYPLFLQSGLKDISVSPRMVYVDSSRPKLVDGFSKKTFIAMVEAVKDQALSMNLIDKKTWNRGIKDMYRATEQDGTFCYTFFKATAIKK